MDDKRRMLKCWKCWEENSLSCISREVLFEPNMLQGEYIFSLKPIIDYSSLTQIIKDLHQQDLEHADRRVQGNVITKSQVING